MAGILHLAQAGVEGAGRSCIRYPGLPNDWGCPAGRRLGRYPVRVFLCAYMICSHPEMVFNTVVGARPALAAPLPRPARPPPGSTPPRRPCSVVGAPGMISGLHLGWPSSRHGGRQLHGTADNQSGLTGTCPWRTSVKCRAMWRPACQPLPPPCWLPLRCWRTSCCRASRSPMAAPTTARGAPLPPGWASARAAAPWTPTASGGRARSSWAAAGVPLVAPRALAATAKWCAHNPSMRSTDITHPPGFLPACSHVGGPAAGALG